MHKGLFYNNQGTWNTIAPSAFRHSSPSQENYSFYEPLPETHDYLCGSGWCSILYFESFAEVQGTETYFCEPGNILLMRNSECVIHPTEQNGFWLVSFPQDFFDNGLIHMVADCPFYYDFLTSRDSSPEILYYTTKDDGEKWLAAELLKHQLVSNDVHTIKNVKISLALFLTVFHRSHFQDQFISGSTMMTEHKEGQILRYLSEHYATANLSSTAAAFHYHPNYFSTLFHKLFQCEFSSKLRQIRLERARYLLSTSDLSVDQIRAAVGFTEKSYFYKVFREKYEVTPAAFRRQMASHQKPAATTISPETLPSQSQ